MVNEAQSSQHEDGKKDSSVPVDLRSLRGLGRNNSHSSSTTAPEHQNKRQAGLNEKSLQEIKDSFGGISGRLAKLSEEVAGVSKTIGDLKGSQSKFGEMQTHVTEQMSTINAKLLPAINELRESIDELPLPSGESRKEKKDKESKPILPFIMAALLFILCFAQYRTLNKVANLEEKIYLSNKSNSASLPAPVPKAPPDNRDGNQPNGSKELKNGKEASKKR